MGRVLPLKYTAKLVCALHVLDSSHLSPWLQQVDGELEDVLQFLVQMYPHRVTGQMVTALAPQHLRNLSLVKCIKLTPQDIFHILKRCRNLQHLSLRECGHLEMDQLVSLCSSDLWHLVKLDLDSCATLSDQNVHVILREATYLRYLNVANTNITNAAFLIDATRQLKHEVFNKKHFQGTDAKSACSLVSVDVSGCAQLTSTGVRHLCSLAGPTLQSLNISWTGVDFTALLYLSGFSLPAAVQFMLDAEISFGADPTLTSSLHQELSNFHTICRHLEAIEDENEIRAKFLHVFDKPECDQGLESQGQVTFEGQTSEGAAISEGHAVLKEPGTSVSSDLLLCSSSRRQDAKAVTKGSYHECLHEQSAVGTLKYAAVQSALPRSSVQRVEQQCSRIPPVLETCGQVGENFRERSVLEDSSVATTILEPPGQTLTSRLSQKSYQLHCPGQIDGNACFPNDTAESNERQLWNSSQTVKSIPCMCDCHKEEATEIVIVPSNNHTSQTTTSSAVENELLNKGAQSNEHICISADSSQATGDVSHTWLPVDAKESLIAVTSRLSARSARTELHHVLSHSGIPIENSFLEVERREGNKGVQMSSNFSCDCFCHPCPRDGESLTVLSAGQSKFMEQPSEETNLAGSTKNGMSHPLNGLPKNGDQQYNSITEKISKWEENSCDDQQADERLGDDHHADLVKSELSSMAVLTNTAKAITSASETDEGRVKVNVSSTRIEVTSTVPSEVAPVFPLEKMADSKSVVIDLKETEPIFIPSLQHLCVGSGCFEGHGNLSLGVACLDRCLSANSALCSLIILCSENSPDINMVVDVVAHRLPHLKELTVDAAESLANSSVLQLISTCTNLTKIDLTGACFLTDAALLPLCNNPKVEELLLSETCVSRPFVLSIGSIAEHLRVLDLAWCENLDEDSLNIALRECTQLTRLNLRQCPVSDHTLEIIAAHCTQLTILGVSCVLDISDAAVVALVGCLEQLQSVDLSWNSELTDTSIHALLVSCPWLHTAELTGLKRITSASFLPIIADLDRWRKCQALIRYKLLVRKATAPTADLDSSDEDPEDLFMPQRSTSYATSLRSLYLHYCDSVCDRHLQEIVAVCQGSLAIVDYYGEPVMPILFSARAGQLYLPSR